MREVRDRVPKPSIVTCQREEAGAEVQRVVPAIVRVVAAKIDIKLLGTFNTCRARRFAIDSSTACRPEA